MAKFLVEPGEVEKSVAALTGVKSRLQDAHRTLEKMELKGVRKELHEDMLRAVRGSVAYLNVIVSEVYASSQQGGTGPFFEGTAVGPLGTSEFDHAVFRDSALLEEDGGS